MSLAVIGRVCLLIEVSLTKNGNGFVAQLFACGPIVEIFLAPCSWEHKGSMHTVCTQQLGRSNNLPVQMVSFELEEGLLRYCKNSVDLQLDHVEEWHELPQLRAIRNDPRINWTDENGGVVDVLERFPGNLTELAEVTCLNSREIPQKRFCEIPKI